MGYLASSNVEYATIPELQALCKQMRVLIDETVSDLDTGSIQAIKDRLYALEQAIVAVDTEQLVQNSRLDTLEENAANTEITTSEIIDMYEDH